MLSTGERTGSAERGYSTPGFGRESAAIAGLEAVNRVEPVKGVGSNYRGYGVCR